MIVEGFNQPQLPGVSAATLNQQPCESSYLEYPFKQPASSMLVSIHSPYYPHSQMRIRSKSQLRSNNNGEKTQSDFNKVGNTCLPSSLQLMQASNDPVPQDDPHLTYTSLYLEGSQVQRQSPKKFQSKSKQNNLRFIQKRMTVTQTVNKCVPQYVHMNQLMMPPMSKEQLKRTSVLSSNRQFSTYKQVSFQGSQGGIMNADLPPPPNLLQVPAVENKLREQQPSPLLNQRIKMSSHQVVVQPQQVEVSVIDQKLRASELRHNDQQRYMNELFDKFRKTQEILSPSARKKTYKAVTGFNLPILNLDNYNNPNVKSSKAIPIILQTTKNNRSIEKTPKPSHRIEAKSVVSNYIRNTPPKKRDSPQQQESNTERKIEIYDYRKYNSLDPDMPSKRKLRQSSNSKDYDPDILSYRLVKNKINHLEYQPELFKPFTIRQIKNLINDSAENSQERKIASLKESSPSPKRISDKLPPQTTTNVVDRIIEEQLLSRKEQIEMERQRRHQEDVSKKSNQKHEREVVHIPKKEFVEKLMNEVAEKELHSNGKLMERTNSRKIRVRQVMRTQFERQYGTRQAILKPPEIFVAKDSLPEANFKEMAQQVLKGNYDFDQEEYMLNYMLLSQMKKSEKHNLKSKLKAYQERRKSHTITQKFIKSDSKELRKGNAKFITCSTPDIAQQKPPSTIKLLKDLQQKRLMKQREFNNSQLIISDQLNHSSILEGEGQSTTNGNDFSQVLNNSSQPIIDISGYFGKANDSQLFELSTLEINPDETQGSVTLEQGYQNPPKNKIRFINQPILKDNNSSFEQMKYRSQKYYDLLAAHLQSQTSLFKRNLQQIMTQSSNIKPDIDPQIYDKFDQIEDDQQKIGLAIGEFLECEKMIKQQMALKGETLSVRRVQKMEQDEAIPNIIEYMQEQEYSKEINKQNFQNQEALKAMQEEKYESSLIVNQLGKTKVWKPNANSLFAGRKAKQIFQFLY